MGVLGKIFGTDKAIESGLNMIYKAGDALFYTDQEKAADKENKIKQVHQFMNDWMETTKGQNIARRLLAVMITTVWNERCSYANSSVLFCCATHG